MSTEEAVAGPTMSRLDVRFAVHREQLRLAAVLDELTPAEVERAKLCPGWRVRDVVAHLVLGPESTVGGMVVEFARARGDVDRVLREAARRKGAEREDVDTGRRAAIGRGLGPSPAVHVPPRTADRYPGPRSGHRDSASPSAGHARQRRRCRRFGGMANALLQRAETYARHPACGRRRGVVARRRRTGRGSDRAARAGADWPRRADWIDLTVRASICWRRVSAPRVPLDPTLARVSCCPRPYRSVGSADRAGGMTAGRSGRMATDSTTTAPTGGRSRGGSIGPRKLSTSRVVFVIIAAAAPMAAMVGDTPSPCSTATVRACRRRTSSRPPPCSASASDMPR